ncbi:MAG: hypothetical protein WB661_00800 [Candidatus Bathyarchaeia archaeon]
MREGYLPKFAVAVLVLAAVALILSGQAGHVAANPTSSTPQDYCNDYGYYNSSYYYWYPYSYYYGYGYPYDCYYNNYGYYYGYPYYYYSYSYYNAPSNYQLTVATDPANLATVTGGGTFSQGTSASFSVTQTIVQSSSNTRYVFSHWSGDYSGVGSSGTITMNGARKVTAVYQLQYYLSVNAQQNAPVPEGTGWYNAGDTATLTSGSQMIGDSSSRLVFQGWSADGGTTQTGSSFSVKMDAPHSVSAQYKQQYYLQVLTDQGAPYGAGWYDAGSTAQIYVSTPVSTSYGVSIIFNGWQGDIQSNSQSTTVQMDKPKTAIASWRTDSTVLYLTIAIGVIAVLVAAAIIAFSSAGRKRNSSNPAPSRPASTSENHTKKKAD